MSFVQEIKSLAKDHLPKPVFDSLKFIKNLPKRLELGPPVVQIYIHEPSTRCYLGVNNFYSTLISDVQTEATLDLVFFDGEGNQLFSHSERLEHLGCRSFDVSQMLDARGIQAAHGIVTVQLTPLHPRRPAYKSLGLTGAHFFVFYTDQNGSVAHTHPSSVLDPKNHASGPFISNELVHSEGLSRIVLYQCNPSYHPHTMKHFILNAEDQSVVAEASSSLPPLSTRKIVFQMNEIVRVPKILHISLDALPSGNSKPLLCRVYQNGHFSMSHS